MLMHDERHKWPIRMATQANVQHNVSDTTDCELFGRNYSERMKRLTNDNDAP